MAQGLRFEPSTVRRDRVVARTRLTQLLNGRFTHRVTTIIGAAGFGKTTAMALAVENNLLDPVGRDVWLTITPATSSTRDVVTSLATALGVEPGSDIPATIERIADAVWSAAPEDVVLIVDDLHLADDDAQATIGTVLAALPANGHLLLGSRTKVGLALARLRAHGELLEIDEAQLALDDDELAALSGRSSAAGQPSTPGEQHLPRHVATADLQLAAGTGAGADFMWEEVLSSLEPDRLSALRRCSVLDDLDDGLVSAVSDGAYDATTLLDGLPLVERLEGGWRMHAILREALLQRLEPGERRKTLSIAADAEADRSNIPRAVRLYHEAGDPISALDAARQFAIAPTMVQTMDDVRSTRRIVEQIAPDSPVLSLLEALTRFAGLEAHVGPLLIEAADAASAAGDKQLEAVALYRAGQSQLLHHSPNFLDTFERVGKLGETDELARGVHAYFRTILDQLAGRPSDAAAALDDLAVLGRATELSVRAERFYDLGRPEEVAVGLTADDLTILPPGATAFIAISIWARGDSSPEASIAAVSESIERTLRAGYTHPIVSFLSTGSLIALAAGQVDLAQRWTDHGVELVATGVGKTIGEGILIARASVAAVREDDEQAISMLQEEGPGFEYTAAGEPKWPSRSKLVALPLTYLARPELRQMLDRIELGPAISAARTAGQALVALRDTNDPTLSRTLPWNRVNLLRAHVLPHHLVELACAAIAAGHEQARTVLDAVPGSMDHLARVAAGATVAAEIASDILGSTPQQEPFRLHARTLGPITIERDGVVVDAPAFTKRPKVRELFALLIERGRLPRTEVIGLLWPDHDDDEKAQSSLRTTLSTLNDVLDPDRLRGQPAFHLEAGSDWIGLDPRVTTDLAEFEALIAAAQSDDNAGLPARALDEYRRAMELHAGDYLQGVDAAWIVLTRIRIGSLAVNANCRVAELTAAKGEPEEAARWAAAARRIDPLNERAGRLFVAALDAAGDRSAARAAADELLTTLSAAELEPSSATQRVIERLR